ncbi:MAG: hypothetical protein H6843_17530 [Rhodospirillaceae bacterium]|nr:hypothetical protein [Rhodospirillaceae bacterium]
MRIRSLLTGVAMALAVTAGPASAQDAAGLTGTITIELYQMDEAANGGCRTYFSVHNDTDVAVTALQPDIYVFADDGTILRRIVFNIVPTPSGGQRYMALDLNDMSCSDVGRMLLNGVLTCETTEGPRDDCWSVLNTSTRLPVSLDY